MDKNDYADRIEQYILDEDNEGLKALLYENPQLIFEGAYPKSKIPLYLRQEWGLQEVMLPDFLGEWANSRCFIYLTNLHIPPFVNSGELGAMPKAAIGKARTLLEKMENLDGHLKIVIFAGLDNHYSPEIEQEVKQQCEEYRQKFMADYSVVVDLQIVSYEALIKGLRNFSNTG